MDDLTFDFERSLDAQQPAQAAPAQAPGAPPPPGQPKNYRQTVCTYWLRGLCMKGDTCGFLHQFDPSRMPVCRTMLKFGACKEPDCPYKHSLEEIKECNMYKLGFCIYGPACRFKHTRLSGPPPDPHFLEAAKPREQRNINVVANQANDGIVQGEQQQAQRPVRRPRLTGPGDYGPRALPAPGGFGGPRGGRGPGGGGPMQQGGQFYGGGRGRGPPQQQQQQQGQQPFRPPGAPMDAAVLASVGQANLPYGF